MTTFWRWFFRGSGGGPGYWRLLNRWLLGHVFVGILLAFVVDASLHDSANAVLLPLVSVVVGLSFAWGGNALALLQTPEIRSMTRFHGGGFAEYVFAFQTSILVVLSALCWWGLAGLNVFDVRWPTCAHPYLYFVVKAASFTMIALTVRECWQVVIGTQMLLLSRELIDDGTETARHQSPSGDTQNL